MNNQKNKVALECAITVAIASVLNFIPIKGANGFLSLEIWLIPIAILGIRRGMKVAGIAGFLVSIISFLTGQAYALNPIQFILEYPIACSVLFSFGWFSKEIHRKVRMGEFPYWLILYSLSIGVLLKYACHFIAGIFFWGSYAPPGWSPVWYSLVINGLTGVENLMLLNILMLFLLKKGKFLLNPITEW
ncbi:MAG: energy-coupled thiamine transporter ThiT [Streptococcaceae bacterium]|nr:energy-coupled thiamine transporter ThiT [Streptococcaceae bacterium]